LPPSSAGSNAFVFRDQIADLETAKKITLEREHCEAVRYHQYYNIDIGDLSIYHIILNSEKLGYQRSRGDCRYGNLPVKGAAKCMTGPEMPAASPFPRQPKDIHSFSFHVTSDGGFL